MLCGDQTVSMELYKCIYSSLEYIIYSIVSEIILTGHCYKYLSHYGWNVPLLCWPHLFPAAIILDFLHGNGRVKSFDQLDIRRKLKSLLPHSYAAQFNAIQVGLHSLLQFCTVTRGLRPAERMNVKQAVQNGLFYILQLSLSSVAGVFLVYLEFSSGKRIDHGEQWIHTSHCCKKQSLVASFTCRARNLWRHYAFPCFPLVYFCAQMSAHCLWETQGVLYLLWVK